MISPVIITATFPVTTPSVRRTAGYIGWHQCLAVLVLDNIEGDLNTHTITPTGFALDEKVLNEGNAYTISGALGHDLTDQQLLVKHYVTDQVNLGPLMSCYHELAGKARITGIGKVQLATFKDMPWPGMPWNALVKVGHDYLDPITGRTIKFAIIYEFGFSTPTPSHWKDLAVGARVWITGRLSAQDKKTLSYVAKVDQYEIIEPSRDPIVIVVD